MIDRGPFDRTGAGSRPGRADHGAQRVPATAAEGVTGGPGATGHSHHTAVRSARGGVRSPLPEVAMEELRGAPPGNIRLLRVMGAEWVRVVEERVACRIHVYLGALPGLLFDGVDEFCHRVRWNTTVAIAIVPQERRGQSGGVDGVGPWVAVVRGSVCERVTRSCCSK